MYKKWLALDQKEKRATNSRQNGHEDWEQPSKESNHMLNDKQDLELAFNHKIHNEDPEKVSYH